MLTPQLQATEPAIEQRLQQYFQLLNSTSGPTDPGIFSAASGYWLKGIHGQHISVSRFFLLHEPGEWQVEEVQQAGDYAAVTISFDSANYSQPWLVQFELLRADGNWMLTEFSDQTLRPFDDNDKTQTELVIAYLEVIEAAIALRSNTDDTEQLNRIKLFYEPGAGFWKSGAVYSVGFMLWIDQQEPRSYAVTRATESEVTVRFNETRRRGDQSVRFTMVKDSGRYYIAQYVNEALEQQQEAQEIIADQSLEALEQLSSSDSTPKQVVSSQLDILAGAGKGAALYTVMNEVVERSEPLWVSSKTARSSLGRLIGIYAGMSVQAPSPTWEFVLEGAEDNTQVVIARPNNPEELGAFSSLLDGIRFQTIRGSGGWKIEHAVAFRD
jgi:hypothetical protein|tara:strand:- start:76 stop:1224 length:1149 start_codon:yes stop_codon:yes gene_type:complete